MNAPPERVFALADATERWPEILPHYRSVEVLRREGAVKEVVMACVRPFGAMNFPCRWRAVQTSHPAENRIEFRHLAGPAKGMAVEWTIKPHSEGGCVAAIRHIFAVSVPVLGPLYADRIIGHLFVRAVAGRTLARIKSLAEGP